MDPSRVFPCILLEMLPNESAEVSTGHINLARCAISNQSSLEVLPQEIGATVLAEFLLYLASRYPLCNEAKLSLDLLCFFLSLKKQTGYVHSS